MHRLILAGGLAIGLGACSPTPPPASDMRSVVLFDPARFAGTWTEVQSGAQWHVGADLTITSPRMNGAAKITGPGRMTVTDSPAPLWVLWVDEGYRTVVIGTPDRSFAYILNRGGDIAPDRQRAAREILDWNGYDIGAGA